MLSLTLIFFILRINNLVIAKIVYQIGREFMIHIFLASLIASHCAALMATDDQDRSSACVVETSSCLIQVPQDSQMLIDKLHQYVRREGLNGINAHKRLEAVEFLSQNHDTENFLPGALIFLGASEKNIQSVVLCLQNDQCGLLSVQDGITSLNFCHLTDLNLSQFPYCAICKNADVFFIDKVDTDHLRFNVEGSSVLNQEFNHYFVNKECLPYVLSPKDKQITLTTFKAWIETHQQELKELMNTQGALLLRGLPINDAEGFSTIVKAVLGRELIDYKGEGSRRRIVQGVYTSTEAPPEFKIPLHNELSCSVNPVDYICFYCDIAPNPGAGQTILARTEDVTLEMMKRPHLWNLFNGKNINYISRHPPEGNFYARVNPTHRTWQQAFETKDKEEVERICEQKGYDFKWDEDWIEVTRHVPAIHGPDQYFDYPYWFNQVHLYYMNPRLCGGWLNYQLFNLLYFASSTKPYDIKFEDGSEITQEVIYEIYDILDQVTIKFNWEKGDVLLLDNRKTLHGRAPYIGPRRILATMIQ